MKLTKLGFNLIQKIFWVIFLLPCKIFLNLKVRGGDNLKDLSAGGALFLANHCGKLDAFLIGTSIPWSYYGRIKRLRFITFPKYITRSIFGPFIWLLGAYPVYQYGGNLDRSLKSTVRILQDNQSVLIFPTGNRCRDFSPYEARPGAAYLAKKLNTMIVPVLIKDSYNITVKNFILRERRVEVIFGKPFHYQEVAAEAMDLRQLARAMMEQVKALDE